jgi:hypothetical protein
MKINAIQYTQNISALTNKRFLNNSVQNDVFVRTEQVSFGKKKTRIEQAKDFAKDVKKYYYDEPFSLQGIQKVAQKGVKDIQVKDYRELNVESEVLKTFMGALLNSFSYDEEKQQVVPNALELYLKNPDENNHVDRVAFYANCVHEYTHALQQTDKDVSDISVLNKLLRKSKATADVKNTTITHIGDFALEAEQRIKKPIYDAEKDIDKQFRYTMSPPTISQIYENEGIKDIKKFAINEIKNLMPKYEEKYGEMDKQILLSYTINHLQKENEAYQADYEAHKRMNSKYADKSVYWNINAVIQLYRVLSEIKV